MNPYSLALVMLAATASASEPVALEMQLPSVTRVYVEKFGGGESAAQLRDMIIASVQSLRSSCYGKSDRADVFCVDPGRTWCLPMSSSLEIPSPPAPGSLSVVDRLPPGRDAIRSVYRDRSGTMRTCGSRSASMRPRPRFVWSTGAGTSSGPPRRRARERSSAPPAPMSPIKSPVNSFRTSNGREARALSPEAFRGAGSFLSQDREAAVVVRWISTSGGSGSVPAQTMAPPC